PSGNALSSITDAHPSALLDVGPVFSGNSGSWVDFIPSSPFGVFVAPTHQAAQAPDNNYFASASGSLTRWSLVLTSCAGQAPARPKPNRKESGQSPRKDRSHKAPRAAIAPGADSPEGR